MVVVVVAFGAGRQIKYRGFLQMIGKGKKRFLQIDLQQEVEDAMRKTRLRDKKQLGYR